MKFRHLNDLLETNRVVSTDNMVQRHLVLRDDRMGYSMHDIIINADGDRHFWFKHHLVSLYCVEGEGEITCVADGKTYPLSPGSVCALDQNDEHIIRARSDLRLVSVFSPPLTGTEQADEEGSYAPYGEETIFVIGLNEFNKKLLSHIDRADHYNFVKLLDLDQILEQQQYDIKKIIQDAKAQIRGYKGSVDGVVHYIDFPVSTTVPIICDAFDLPSASLEAVLKCEHKYWSRIEQRAVVPDYIPNFIAFDPFDDQALEKIHAELDFPFWIKPVKSFSSYLGFRIDSAEDFKAAIPEIRENIGRFSGPFNYLLEMIDMPPEFEAIGGEYCIAEGIIGGMQCTQEGFSCKGEVEVYGTIDSFRESNGTTFSSYQYPSILPEHVVDRMTTVTQQVIKRIGYDNAPFNIEYYWQQETDQIWLLEINSRISESHCQLFEKVDGSSHHQVAVELAAGRRPMFPHRQGKFNCAGKFFLREWEDAYVEAVPDPEVIRHMEQELIPDSTIIVTAEKGKRLSELMDQDSYSYRVALLFLGGTDKQDLERKRQLAEDVLYEHFVFNRD